ncbi:unnamed protein product [Lota lota]
MTSLREAPAAGSRQGDAEAGVEPPAASASVEDARVEQGGGPLILSVGVARGRGYPLRLTDRPLKIRVPLTSLGIDVKSAVVEGRYGQGAGVQRQDERWPLTQHRSFRLLRTPVMPRGPPLTSAPIAPELQLTNQSEARDEETALSSNQAERAHGTGSTTMLVDTVFEMTYSTGQWTRLKKYKPIATTS